MSESRQAWTNGQYRVVIYSTAGAPNPAADAPPLGAPLDVACLGDALFDAYRQFGDATTTRAFVMGALREIRKTKVVLDKQVEEAKILNTHSNSLAKEQRRR